MNKQLGGIISGLDDVINSKTTKSLFVFGDVTSTLAGASCCKE